MTLELRFQIPKLNYPNRKCNTYFIVEKAFGTEGISKWRQLRYHAGAYARATTLHGFAYMGETERHWKEK